MKTEKLHVFEVSADIGSVKLGNNDVFFYFSNGFGDGRHQCEVYEKGHELAVCSFPGHFEGCFTVREWRARSRRIYLYSYDCGGEKIYAFEPGRYFVYSNEGLVSILYLDDDDID